jgi:gamma-glutamyltranspeptidase/glutathione hydrolase
MNMSKPIRRLPRPRSMIVAPQPEAVEAGADMLRAGGNAIDAVLSCAFTQGVVDPMMSGIGGLGVLQIFDPASGRTVVLDGLSTCPAACHEEMWAGIFERECADGYGYQLTGGVNELGHRAVTTPGILRLLAQAHASYGHKPWSALFDQAVGFAEEGWIIRPHVAGVFATNEAAYGRLPYSAKLAFTEDGKRLYMRPDGTPKRAGDPVRNPDLAATLRLVARDGAEAFYTGEMARRIVADMERQGGLLTLADLAGFTPLVV